MPATFVPSLELNAAFHAEVVAPLVRPVEHAAALLGWGSDVLGYDTARSTDHGWGPRLQVFVAENDVDAVRGRVDAGLPKEFRGWPVRFGWDNAPEQHRVDVLTWRDWLQGQLGVQPLDGMNTLDWLTVPQQQLLGVVRGAVYADPAGELAATRKALAWYPPDVWRWLVAAQWGRIAQEVAFVGRTAEVGDDLGSAVLAARLVRDLTGLGFLLAREYRPYTKWVGTAFARLPGADALVPPLRRAVAATDFESREQALVEAYELIGRWHNESGVSGPVDPHVRPYHSRPFRVPDAEGFAQACRNAIEDPWLRELPLVGSVDQFVDSTDVLSAADRTQHLRALYTGLSTQQEPAQG
ncbi:DUF4037 domain-containing protein [Actinopolymorpha sp. NPDC004070]|uniref:DUF4037 domain-containing protein n=1 Tax=Actinopolymorpha sp. NPDC004070 TaxID=3154548 RepID=UPI0033AACF44